jgi:hypothetical protein
MKERTEIFPHEPLDARRLVQQLQQHLMQPCILLHALLLDKLNEPWEGALRMHHPKNSVVSAVSAIIQQHRGDDVERGIVIFLDPISIIPRSNLRSVSHTCRRQYIIWRRTYSVCVTKSSPCSRRKTHFAML